MRYQCRVVVADDEAFPTNKFRSEMKKDPTTKSWQRGRSFSMLREYCRFTLTQTPKAKYALLADQLENVYGVVTVALTKVLVDEVLQKHDHIDVAEAAELLLPLALGLGLPSRKHHGA